MGSVNFNIIELCSWTCIYAKIFQNKDKFFHRHFFCFDNREDHDFNKRDNITVFCRGSLLLLFIICKPCKMKAKSAWPMWQSRNKSWRNEIWHGR